jgi:hydrogenase expression/formation protein HypE
MPIADLQRIADSFGQAARDVGVRIVTGDTKVVDRGKGDGVYINTTGIGRVPHGLEIGPQRAQPGDAVILTGPIAAHGIAILALRQGLDFGTPLRSDSAPLCDLANLLVDALFNDVHVLRDPTRGGLASALNEIAETAGVGFLLDEAAIAVPDTARAACELLGLDPLYVANEGKFVAIVAAERADEAVHLLRQHPQGSQASLIGRVTAEHAGRVLARSCVGGIRTVDRLVGDQLPRIC